jgi:hypothetical protein
MHIAQQFNRISIRNQIILLESTFRIFSIAFDTQVVDMRWGVRDEMTNEHMTTGR